MKNGRPVPVLQSSPHSKARLSWWISGGASIILAAILLAVWIHPTARQVVYRRYVSPPFKDGTRYTFLYPADLTNIRVVHGRRSSFGPGRKAKFVNVQAMLIQGHLDPVAAVIERSNTLTALADKLHPRDMEQVRVYVIDDLAEPSIHLTGARVPSENPRYTRSEFRPAGSGIGYWVHGVTVTDGKAGMRYSFSHLYAGPGAGSAFGRDDATIAASFRVLPPGAFPTDH